MAFSEALRKHVEAIRKRDLTALAETLPPGRLTLIMADGRLVDSAEEFLELHRGWFESTTWTLDFAPVSQHETPDLGVAVFRLDYRDTPADGPPIREASHLTLVFARQEAGWVMVLDQNTPIRKAPEAAPSPG